MLIEQIKFIENGDFNYYISFIYKGHNIQTDSLSRSATAEELLPIIRKLCTDFDAQRAETNYDALKAQFEGQTVEI